MDKIIGKAILVLLGVLIGASVVYLTTPAPTHEEQCYKSVSYQVEGDKVVETWLPANDYCK